MYKPSLFISSFEVYGLDKTIFIMKLFGLVIIISFVITVFIMPQYATEYNAAIIDKYERLGSIDEPKIILVGDSNVAFGFNSEKIQQVFDMPVVNMGLHGALDPTFCLELIKRHISEGDIIIVAPQSYASRSSYDWVMTWLTIENNYFLWDGIQTSNYNNMILAFPTYLKRVINLWIGNTGNKQIDGVYARASFNEYGDIVFPRPSSRITEERYGSHFLTSKLSQTLKVYFNEYNEYVESKKASLFMSSPPILSLTLDGDLASLQNQLEADLDFPMISKLENYIYPLEFFYDSGLHLNEYGLDARTDQIILDLISALNQYSGHEITIAYQTTLPHNYYLYNLGDRINFTPDNNNSRTYFVRGLHAPSEAHTWSSGLEAVFYAKLDRPITSDIMMSIRFWVNGKQTIRLHSNSRLITERTFDDGYSGSTDFIIPQDVVSEGNILQLRFEFPDAKPPLNSLDTRQLAIAFIEMVIDTYDSTEDN